MIPDTKLPRSKHVLPKHVTQSISVCTSFIRPLVGPNTCSLAFWSCFIVCSTFVRIVLSYSASPKGSVYLTNRFHVAVRLFSNRSQMTSKCGKNKKVAHEAQPSVSLMFLPHFDVICDLLLNRRTATWNLFVLYNKKIKIHGKNALLFEISPL